MRYPTINQYTETILNSYSLFKSLDIEPCRDMYGEIIFIAGNYSVVFAVMIDGEKYALKCYTRAIDNITRICKYIDDLDSDCIIGHHYIEKEIYVYDEYGVGDYYPVSLMPWVDGVTLYAAVAKYVHRGDSNAIALLAQKFDSLAYWLLGQEFAHGDIKDDNILVDSQGELKLVDFDGAYIPEFEGQESNVIGSLIFQHPKRDNRMFNKHIDDYPLVMICVTLHALAADITIHEKSLDGYILNAQTINTSGKNLLDNLEDMWYKRGELGMVRMCGFLRSTQPDLSNLRDAFGAVMGLNSVLKEDVTVIDQFSEQEAIIRRDGLYGFADMQNKSIIIEPVFKEALCVRENLAAVQSRRGWYYIDRSGREVINCFHYDTVQPFRCGRALVSKNGRYGFIDLTGNEVIPVQYEFATGFSDDLAVIRVAEKYGYINLEGNVILQMQYDKLSCMKNGFADAEKDGFKLKIDKKSLPLGL